MTEEIPLPPGGDLAGFESWRKELYGAEEAVRLGLSILPALLRGNVQTSGDDLKKLKHEADLIAQYAAMFASRIGTDERTIRVRAENIGRACDLALSADALVWIS